MRYRFAGLIAACALASAAGAADLAHWAPDARARIEAAIAHAPAGSYAVFDADNTIWQNDLEEALLPFLENRGDLSSATLGPALRPVPLLPGESLYGYYRRLCDIDDKLCYPWIAQVFAGRSLGQLKADVDAMMASAAPIPVRYREQGREVSATVLPPAIHPGQRELIAALRAKGIRVYVVTAAAEELSRMILADPRYGLDIPARDVIGVTLLLRDPKDGSVTTARRQIALGHFLDADYPLERHRAMILTPTLWTPETWFEGKVSGIQDYIDPVRRPWLAAGDSRSDWPMLFYASGMRVWVNHDAGATEALDKTRAARAATEASAGLHPPLGADQGWLVTTPALLDAKK